MMYTTAKKANDLIQSAKWVYELFDKKTFFNNKTLCSIANTYHPQNGLVKHFN
jgi:hypothetical protein